MNMLIKFCCRTNLVAMALLLPRAILMVIIRKIFMIGGGQGTGRLFLYPTEWKIY
jgi:hypothetical protein